MPVFVFLFIFVFVFTTISQADIIYFKSGGEVVGVVQEETEETITIETELGVMSWPRDKVESIKRSSPEEREALVKKWEEEKKRKEEEEKQRAKAKAAYEEKQRAKGLVKYSGKWMKPEQREELMQIDTEIESLEGEIESIDRLMETARKDLLSASDLESATELSNRIDELKSSVAKKVDKLEELKTLRKDKLLLK